MASIADPVGQGLVSSLARPGGNVTGMSLQSVEITAKRLELLKEAIPAAARVAVLQNPNNPVGARSLQELEPAARTLGLQVQVLDIRPPEDLEPALDAAVREHADMLLVTSDPLFGQRYSQIADLAAKRHVPALHPRREFVEAGGLMSYGPSVPDLWRRSAAYVDKILSGASPADLPVEQPMTFDFAINLKTARALGLTIPQEVLMQATEVIQ
jgi:putative ABC transport system substrate-binding protein